MTRNSWEKREIQIEAFNQKGSRLQDEFNVDIMEDLQGIIGFNVVKDIHLQTEKEKQIN